MEPSLSGTAQRWTDSCDHFGRSAVALRSSYRLVIDSGDNPRKEFVNHELFCDIGAASGDECKRGSAKKRSRVYGVQNVFQNAAAKSGCFLRCGREHNVP